jgi:CheY-like chemotaxis protein
MTGVVSGPLNKKPERRLRVLIVEDDPAIREVMRQSLEEDHLEIVEAGDGEQALAECERESPAVIVLDLGLPTMSGQDFVAAYRQLQGHNAAIVVVSAISNADRVAQSLGAAAFVPKPFSILDLSETVTRVATH